MFVVHVSAMMAAPLLIGMYGDSGRGDTYGRGCL